MKTQFTRLPLRPPVGLAFYAALAVAGLFIAGCATEVANYTLLGKPHPAKPANAHIEVFTNGVPAQPFERVAILDVCCESQGFLTPNLEHDAMPMFIKQAQAAGCDAIIEIAEHHGAENWTLETKVKKFSAVGIVYK
jgi:hypothetical protein